MRYVLSAVAAVTLTMMAPSAWSHHSAAMFEPTKSIELDGTVKEFQWTNPHSWLQLMAPDGKGGQEEWSLELGPLVGLARGGWKPRTLQPGEKVKVSFHPMRDGSHGGRLISVTTPAGHVYNGQAGAPSDAPAPGTPPAAQP
jgi:hypothetical protein